MCLFPRGGEIITPSEIAASLREKWMVSAWSFKQFLVNLILSAVAPFPGA
jgi:hypothetical protein